MGGPGEAGQLTAEAVLSYLAAQEEAMRAGDRALRAGDRDAVHHSRVGARRARSTLRTFSGLFPKKQRKAVLKSMRAYAAGLGEVRDLQVLREVLAEHAKGDLAEWLEQNLDRGLFVGWQRLELELETPLHRDVRDELSALLFASVSAEIDVDKCVRKAAKRADKRLARAGDNTVRLHEARKAAKRARYAAEAARGPDAMIDYYERLQDLLGRHHDLSVAATYLDRAEPPAPLRADAVELGLRLCTEAEVVRLEAIACVHDPHAR